MKKLSTKIIATILSFVFIFTGVFSLAVSAEEYVNFQYASEPYDEETIYYEEYSSLFYTERIYFKIKYLDTPNTQNAVISRIYLDDLSDEEISSAYNYVRDEYPYATFLSSATNRYNCHSYAWYSQDVDTNEYWIPDPKTFYEDHSYCTVSTPQVGDIICYFNNMGTTDTSDDFNVHSGIVTAVSSGTSNNVCGTADLVTVTSKWGSYGLYSHNGLDCPYTPNNGGEADYVKYYRSEHNNRLDFLNGEQHLSICRSCNYTQCLPHEYSISQDDSTNHLLTCGCGFDKTEAHYGCTYTSKNTNVHYVYCKCGYLIEEDYHNMAPSGTVGFSACRECGYLRSNSGSSVIIKGEKDEPVTE